MRTAITIGVALAVVAIIASCTAPPAPPSPAPTPVSMPDAVVLTDQGSGSASLEVPAGAHSLTVRVACDEGTVSVNANVDARQLPHGPCGGMYRWQLPLSKSPLMTVSIQVFPGSDFVAELQFSEAELSIDDAVAADCDLLGITLSAAFNADSGFHVGELDAAGWQSKVEEGLAALREMEPSPIISEQVDPLRAWFEEASVPGQLSEARSPEAIAAESIVHQICTDNHSGILLMGEYGG